MDDNVPRSLSSLFETASLGEKQRANERLMFENATQQFHDSLTKASVQKYEQSTFYGRELIEKYLSDATAAIRAELESKKKTHAIKVLRTLAPDADHSEALAYLTLWTLLACATTRCRVTTACADLGRAVEMWRRTTLRERAVRLAAKKARASRITHAEHDTTRWTAKIRIEVGLYLIETINAKLAIFEKEEDLARRKGKRKGALYFVPSDEITMYVDQARKRGEVFLARPAGWPMCVAPRRWRDAFRGGHLTKLARKRFPLLQRSHKHAKVSRDDASRCLSTYVLDAVNAVQRTPYRVNRWILDQMKAARAGTTNKTGNQLLPQWMPKSSRPKLRRGARGHESRTQAKARRAWDQAAKWNNPQHLTLQRVLDQATQTVSFKEIFLPVFLDYRGRLCYRPELSPQGSKAARALLEASEACVISTPEDLRWLKIHVANCFGQGIDRRSYDERVAWVDDNHDEIVRAGTEPWQTTWWVEQFKDQDWAERWQFLAACHEYASCILQDGPYESHAIVYLDGTCNGLQHLSAMSRDESAGSLVNLVPRPGRADIYQEVWDRTKSEVHKMTGLPGIDGACAKAWEEVRGNRELVKKVVMNFPNGVSDSTAKRYLWEQLKPTLTSKYKDDVTPFSRCAKYDKKTQRKSLAEKKTKKKPSKWRGCRVAVNWLYDRVLKDLMRCRLLARAMSVQAFLRDAASLAARSGLPLQWTTPDGFVVHQHFLIMSRPVAHVRFSPTNILRARIEVPTRKLNKIRQTNAVVPNFVHSMDATALRFYVREAVSHGITVFALAHDCYGCRVTDVPKMRKAIAVGFIRTYESCDPLAEFLERLAESLPAELRRMLPVVPERGKLELAGVVDSEYFFS